LLRRFIVRLNGALITAADHDGERKSAQRNDLMV
jgi:hypothetical protein